MPRTRNAEIANAEGLCSLPIWHSVCVPFSVHNLDYTFEFGWSIFLLSERMSPEPDTQACVFGVHVRFVHSWALVRLPSRPYKSFKLLVLDLVVPSLHELR